MIHYKFSVSSLLLNANNKNYGTILELGRIVWCSGVLLSLVFLIQVQMRCIQFACRLCKTFASLGNLSPVALVSRIRSPSRIESSLFLCWLTCVASVSHPRFSSPGIGVSSPFSALARGQSYEGWNEAAYCALSMELIWR